MEEIMNGLTNLSVHPWRDPRNAGVPPPEARVELDTLLRRALVQRDEHALAEAVRRMRPAMSRIAMDHVVSPDDAEDLIQETWLAALHGIGRFQGRALLSTWLLRILSYRARTLRRRAARSMPFSRLTAVAGEDWEAWAEPLVGGRAAGPDETVRARELEESIAAAMEGLPRASDRCSGCATWTASPRST
jgi:RNA polymerase sigma-70 factor (ECF subfamily)